MLGIGISSPVSAHLPIFEAGGQTIDTALKIPDANVSYAITAEFTSSSKRIHFYAFSVEAGHVLNVALAVPAIPDLEEFAPVLLLIGPRLPSPDEFTTRLVLGFEINVHLGLGMGAVSYVYGGVENVRTFEPFTQVNMWDRQELEVLLPSQAVYYLAVAVPEGWSQDARSSLGKYILVSGLLEEFSLLDYVAIPLDWIRWHQFWEHSLVLFMLPTILVTAIGILFVWYYSRSGKKDVLANLTTAIKVPLYVGLVGALLILGSVVNQVSLVFGYTRFSFELVDYIVLTLQTIGFFLGLVALRVSLSVRRRRSLPALVFAVLVVVLVSFGALLVGAGWIVGPFMFAIGTISALVIVNRSIEKGASPMPNSSS